MNLKLFADNSCILINQIPITREFLQVKVKLVGGIKIRRFKESVLLRMDPLFRKNIVRPMPKKNIAIYTAFNFKTEEEMQIKNRYILHKLILICSCLLVGVYITK